MVPIIGSGRVDKPPSLTLPGSSPPSLLALPPHRIGDRKVANEELIKGMERKQRIMFMDPSGVDEKA
jgi:hypothetical protein